MMSHFIFHILIWLLLLLWGLYACGMVYKLFYDYLDYEYSNEKYQFKDSNQLFFS